MRRCTKHTKNNNAIVQDVTQKPYKLTDDLYRNGQGGKEMNRKLVSTALAAAMVCSMGAASATTVSAEEQKTVGILMPTQSSERWINDGANMKKQLEEKGYKVELQYAEDDTAMQVSQLENYVGKGG